ncbi:MAG: stage II sporulation protein R [Bacillota bacterium]
MYTRKRTIIEGLIICLALGILLGAELAALAKAAPAVSQSNLVRLHIMANSDRLDDQAVKLVVRDVVVRHLSPRLAGVDDRKAAEAVIAAELGTLEALARAVLRIKGFSYGAAASLADGEFPERVYGALTLPAGSYRTLRLVLGQGQGHNWWCVVFPPLCFMEITGSTRLTADEEAAVLAMASTIDSQRPAVVEKRFLLLEVVQRLLKAMDLARHQEGRNGLEIAQRE